MREKVRKSILTFAGLALAVLIMLNPATAKKAMALTPVTPLTVNKPSDIYENIGKKSGFVYTTERGTKYYCLEIAEKGWVAFYGDSECVAPSYGNFILSDDIDFKTDYRSSWKRENGYYIRKFYLNPGRYYIKHYCGSVNNVYGYYIPNSKFFSASLIKKNCDEKNLYVQSNGTFTHSALLPGALPVTDVFRDDVNTTSNMAYSITSNGYYTLFLEDYSDEWKDYNFMYSFYASGIGTHPNSTTSTTKATFSKDGKIVKRCNECKNIVSTTIIPRIDTISFGKSAYEYTGKKIYPNVTLYDRTGKRISSINYDVICSNNTKIGKAEAKIVLSGNNYSGTIKKTFTIVPKAVEVKSVTGRTRAVTVKWKKASGVNGYDVQISTSSSFPSSKTRTKSFTSGSKDNVTLKSLMPKTTYCVRIRTYKTVSGKKYYSKWSKTMKVRTR